MNLEAIAVSKTATVECFSIQVANNRAAVCNGDLNKCFLKIDPTRYYAEDLPCST